MNRRQTRAVTVGLLGFLGMFLYVALLKVERDYCYYGPPGPGGLTAGMTVSKEVQSVRYEPEGFGWVGWVWSEPEIGYAHSGGVLQKTREVLHQIDWPRQRLLVEGWALLIMAAVVFLRLPKLKAASSDEYPWLAK
jgi:hypothetical protein